MSYRERLQSWAVIRQLQGMQRITVHRFCKESDADGYAKALRQLIPNSTFLVIFDPPTLNETSTESNLKEEETKS